MLLQWKQSCKIDWNGMSLYGCAAARSVACIWTVALSRWSPVHHIRQCFLCFCGFIFIPGSDMHCPQLYWFLGEDAERCLRSAWADLMWLPQEMLNIGSTSTHHHFALLPRFSSIYTPAGAASGGRTIEVSSLTPAATPALIEPVPDEVMTWSFVLNHCL